MVIEELRNTERELAHAKEKLWVKATVEQKLDFLLSEIQEIRLKLELQRAQQIQMYFLRSKLTQYHSSF